MGSLQRSAWQPPLFSESFFSATSAHRLSHIFNTTESGYFFAFLALSPALDRRRSLDIFPMHGRAPESILPLAVVKTLLFVRSRTLLVEEMLTVGQKLNDHWDQSLALRRLHLLDIRLRQRVGQLSGGQQAQLALILTLAKRPALLLLDEPVASLDPLARHEFQHTLMDAVAEDGLSVIISSHIVADMERFCNYLVILSASRAHIADRIDHLLQSHKLLTGPREAAQAETGAYTILASREVEQQCSLLVRTDSAITNPVWQVRDVSLEEIILAYLARPEREKAGAENKKGKVRP